MPIITPAYPCMNSSYNVSTCTLRVLMEEFRGGNETCEAIEANKGSWAVLFEPFAFFEAYKNYLQIDIAAETDNQLRNWKGWVESRIRLLTLKIERDSGGVFQCHPHPGEFSDKSKPIHHSYFMGLRRKEGTNPHEGVQFDVRMTVEDFKRGVYAYSFWEPSMWIHVSHVERKDIPSFVFPGGVRPSHPSRNSTESRSALKSFGSNSPQADVMSRKKRKQDVLMKGASNTESLSTSVCSNGATLSDQTLAEKQFKSEFGDTTCNNGCPEDISGHDHNVAGFGISSIGPSPSSAASSVPLVTEKPITEQSSVQIVGQESNVKIKDGVVEYVELKSEVQHNGQDKETKSLDYFSSTPAVAAIKTVAPFSKNQQNGDLEEIEVSSSNFSCFYLDAVVHKFPLKLTAMTPVSTATQPLAQKPLIRFSFTSLAKAGN